MGQDLYIQDLDDTLYRFLDADHRSKKDAVETSLTREYGGEKQSALDVRIEHAENRIDLLSSEIEDLKLERERQRQELEALRAQREEIAEEEQSYEDALGEFLEEFANSRAVLTRFRSEAKEIAAEHGVTLDTIEEDLRELAEELPYEIGEERWTNDYGEGF